MEPQALKISDLMTTAVVTAKASDRIEDAEVAMRLARIRHLPVLDARGHLMGIVSNRDLLGAVVRAGGKAIHLLDVMTRAVRTIHADAPARDGAAMMLEHKIGSLPVLGEDEQLVGMVTETDFLRLAYQRLLR
jgi:CBS domain-containing membrane protein